MYRFRNINNLLGKHKELEKQEIYFASLNQLNDPIEGYRSYYWKGDKIVWKNLLKHYILCLEHVIGICRICDEKDGKENYRSLPIYLTRDSLLTDLHKKRIDKIYKLFFEDDFVQLILNIIDSNPYKVYREELYFYLRNIHIKAVKSIEEIDFQDGFIKKRIFGNLDTKQFNYKDLNIDDLWNELNLQEYRVSINERNNVFKKQDMKILLKIENNIKLRTILIEFPELYMNQVLQLVYPATYTACFMREYKDSSIWGTYGDNHKGICLKFKTNLNNPRLKLKTISSWSSGGGYNYEFRNFELKPVNYTNEVYELDFFTNLGKLTMPKIKEWYKSEDGELSICAENVFNNKDKWRKKHWNQFEPSLLRKLPDWEKEKEYRILLTSVLGDYEDRSNRLLKYDFNDLETLIFGLRTPMEAKREVINIIKNKCMKNNRKKFDFYEMYYSSIGHKLERRKIYSIDL